MPAFIAFLMGIFTVAILHDLGRMEGVALSFVSAGIGLLIGVALDLLELSEK